MWNTPLHKVSAISVTVSETAATTTNRVKRTPTLERSFPHRAEWSRLSASAMDFLMLGTDDYPGKQHGNRRPFDALRRPDELTGAYGNASVTRTNSTLPCNGRWRDEDPGTRRGRVPGLANGAAPVGARSRGGCRRQLRTPAL